LKIKCEDGFVRNFRTSHCDGERGISGSWESICYECKTKFGIHDTKILKPIWRKHKCTFAVDTIEKLKRIVSKDKQEKETDICECGHVKWMHSTSSFTDRIGHCRVHGCRPNENNNPDGCKKFRRKTDD
jgi:hypothetical protein